MNAIYKLLASGTYGSFDDVQIVKLCEYVHENYGVHPVSGGSRIIVQLGVHASNSALSSDLSRIYSLLVGSSKTELDEFVLLGSAVARLVAAINHFGPAAMKGSKLGLPFQDLEYEPKNYTLQIGSRESFEGLALLWGYTAGRLLSPELLPTLRSSSVGDVVFRLTEICAQLRSQDVSPQVVTCLCDALSTATAANSLSGFRLPPAAGILRWAEQTLLHVAKDQSRLTQTVVSELCTALHRVGATCTHLIKTAAMDHGSDAHLVACFMQGAVSVLSTCVVPHAIAVCQSQASVMAAQLSSSALGASAARNTSSAVGTERSRSMQGGRPPLALQVIGTAAANKSSDSMPNDPTRAVALSAAGVALVRLLHSAVEHAPVLGSSIVLEDSTVRMLTRLCGDLSLINAVARLLVAAVRAPSSLNTSTCERLLRTLTVDGTGDNAVDEIWNAKMVQVGLYPWYKGAPQFMNVW
jgi:hypothetical protein